MSTRVEGVEVSVRVEVASATFVAGDTCLRLTVRQEDTRFWRYNVSRMFERGSRLAFGGLFAPDYLAALRRAARLAAEGFQPGGIERGLLDGFAQEESASAEGMQA
jgi:hypothetical protein